MRDDTIRREADRDINRVYINSEPKVLGYLGEVTNSPDYQPGLDSGRYIVVEFPWPKRGMFSTYASGSTTQAYSIIANKDIILEDGTSLTNVVFNQTATVNTIIDQFEEGTTPLTGAGDTPPDLGYTQYIHKDTNGQPVQGLPLYLYFHGNTRGGNIIGDSYAPLRSANGAIALMKKMEEEPRFASHILAFRSSAGHIGNGHAPVDQVKAVIDDLIAQGLADENRIYVSGFS
jgi:predicted peptidase